MQPCDTTMQIWPQMFTSPLHGAQEMRSACRFQAQIQLVGHNLDLELFRGSLVLRVGEADRKQHVEGIASRTFKLRDAQSCPKTSACSSSAPDPKSGCGRQKGGQHRALTHGFDPSLGCHRTRPDSLGNLPRLDYSGALELDESLWHDLYWSSTLGLWTVSLRASSYEVMIQTYLYATNHLGSLSQSQNWRSVGRDTSRHLRCSTQEWAEVW